MRLIPGTLPRLISARNHPGDRHNAFYGEGSVRCCRSEFRHGMLRATFRDAQQRVNTLPVLFDGAVSLKDHCYDGNVVGWLAHEINRLFQPESPPARAATTQRSTLAGHVPAVVNAREAAYPDFVS